MKYWFPLGLIAILLLTLPALALFTLDLFGYEAEANAWMQDRFDISHHVPLTEWATLLLFLVLPLLILLYFLKLKRQTRPVPSTFLWKKSVEDLRVNRLMQWLRRNVLLLLQLLVIMLLLYGIIAPRLHGRRSSGRHYILMIDNSASMSTVDAGKDTSRLEWAKEQALREIDAATDEDFGMVIVFNATAEIRQSYTADRGRLRDAIAGIEATQRPTHIDEALRLADSLANPLRSTEDESARPQNPEPGQARTYVPTEGVPTEVYLYSDGRFPDVPEFALANLDLRYKLAGQETTENLGIVSFGADRGEDDPTQVQVFARLLNFGASEREVAIRLDVYVNGELAFPMDRRVKISGRGQGAFADPDAEGTGLEPGKGGVTFEIPGLEREADVRMTLQLTGNSDPFPLDDTAWLALGLVRKARVLVVGPGNPVLEFFFGTESTKNVCDSTFLPPEKLSDAEAYLDPARSGAYDLVIFDRCSPDTEADMPRANTLFIGRPAPGLSSKSFSELEKIEFPQVRGWSEEHVVMRGIRGWHQLEIAQAFRMPELPPKTPRLLEGEQNLVLLAALSRGGFTDLVLAFPLQDDEGKWNTRWFMRPGFVLFMRNLLYGLGNVRDATTEEAVRPGDVKRLIPAAAVDVIRVETPAGETVTLDRANRAEFTFAQTNEVGVYEARWDGGDRAFTVNLFDEMESDLRPRQSLQIGSAQVQAGEGRDQPRELWKWAVLAALIFLLVEWYIYNRRVYV